MSHEVWRAKKGIEGFNVKPVCDLYSRPKGKTKIILVRDCLYSVNVFFGHGPIKETHNQKNIIFKNFFIRRVTIRLLLLPFFGIQLELGKRMSQKKPPKKR
jgi:hypothetical protein